jgi:hypothetical protein
MLRYIAWGGLILVLAAACGGSEEFHSSGPGSTPGQDASADSAGGDGGSSATGGSAGTAGSGGTTQTGGSAGTAGSGGTTQTGGSAGTAGSGGTTQTGGSAGTAGSGGTGGSSGTGGVGGTSGTGGSAGTGGALPQPECKTADDCTLYSDCCSCIALAPGESPPTCNIPTCFVNTCTAMGVSSADGAQCNAGRCGVGFDCDQSHVLCNAPTPSCAPPTVPSVRGACWGPCVPAQDCSYVSSCADCDKQYYACVYYDAWTHTAHCVDVPGACANDITCACMSQSVCVSPFDACTDDSSSDRVLHCECPTC